MTCRFRGFPVVVHLAALAVLSAPAGAQWNPSQGEWGKDDPDDLRVMTWNVEDSLSSTNVKDEALNDWTAMAVTVAAMKPDILIVQEAGDNDGQGTGFGGDSISELETTISLFLHGGIDGFTDGDPVGAFVQKYDPDFDLPFVFVSAETDGFNRNVILSRYPFGDLNGDLNAKISDIPFLPDDAYAAGGDGGIRGFMFAEIDLPDDRYGGDVVIGNGHLKAFSDDNSQQQRITAAKNVAYYIDFIFYGNGTGTPDPNGAIQPVDCSGNFCIDEILGPDTPVIIGGDWNEDEGTNGRKGPAAWLTEAEFDDATALDGTDRDQSDSVFDSATNPLTGDPDTRGGSKLDYLAWPDSVASPRRAWIFDSQPLNSTTAPEEFFGVPSPRQLSGMIDHLPVLADFPLAEPAAACPADLSGDGLVDGSDLGQVLLAWSPIGPVESPADLDGDAVVDGADLGLLLLAWGACP